MIKFKASLMFSAILWPKTHCQLKQPVIRDKVQK